ncbi:MAG: nitroreductase/quinone reductase family protein [Frankia sp.]
MPPNYNDAIIAEFRANRGKVAAFGDVPLVLLTTTGARTGARHTTPLRCFPDGDRIFVLASAAGAPKHPAWFHNLVAHPEVTVELGTNTFQATAAVAEGAERDRFYAVVASEVPVFAEYQEKAAPRVIPVVTLTAPGMSV